MTTKITHIAYTVRDFKGNDGKDKGHWLEIGRVLAHKDGNGFDVLLEALPLDGRLVLRVPTPKPQEG